MSKDQVIELISFLLILMLVVGLAMVDILSWGLAIDKFGSFGVAAGLILNALAGLYIIGRYVKPSNEVK